MNNLQVIVYTTTTCPYCRMLKGYLEEKSIPFTEKLVDQNEEVKNEMMAKSQGYLGVPFMVVIKDDGKEESIIGFDKTKINQVMGIQE